MNRSELLAELANDSPMSKQLYASSCLRYYCEFKGISHYAITNLLNHLDEISTSHNLAEWDARGALLDLNGRGDPIPESLKSALSSEGLNEFATLVDSVVEVGIVDLYGAKTDLPLKFLDKVMQILEKNEIPLPLLAK
jgi:hypothetical protein